MPAVDTFLLCQRHLRLEDYWQTNGRHYSRTLDQWLARMDANLQVIRELFRTTYGAGNENMWIFRWRMFFIASSGPWSQLSNLSTKSHAVLLPTESFGYNDGEEWFIMHYLFKRPA